MSVLLVYATNSGSTQAACDMVKQNIEKAGHSVQMKYPTQTSFDEISKTDLVILASPSWDYEGVEGQPLEDFNALLKEFEGKTLEGKPFAILGLGDSSYTHFCGAVDIFEDAMKKLSAKLIVPSLRIDRFYQNPTASNTIQIWSQNLLKNV